METTDVVSPKRNVRANARQVEAVLEYMIHHKEFAAGKFMGPRGKENLAKKWQEVANFLNELGPTKKASQWKILWKDMKVRARRRNAEIQCYRATGAKAAPPPLTPNELKVIEIIRKTTSVGLDLEEVWLEGPEYVESVVVDPVAVEPVTSQAAATQILVVEAGPSSASSYDPVLGGIDNETTEEPAISTNAIADGKKKTGCKLSSAIADIGQYLEGVQESNASSLKEIGSALTQIAEAKHQKNRILEESNRIQQEANENSRRLIEAIERNVSSTSSSGKICIDNILAKLPSCSKPVLVNILMVVSWLIHCFNNIYFMW